MNNKVCVLGAGSWGTALALVLAENKYDVLVWTLNKKQCNEVNNIKENKDYLPGVVIPDNLTLTTDISEAVKNSSIIVLATPSQAIRGVCKSINGLISGDQILVNVAKGLEKGTGLRMSQVVNQELPNNKFVALSGPSHAEEVGRKMPTTITVASSNIEHAEFVQDAFMSTAFRVYTNPDVIGVELGGALKNIIAFGAGICDGLGYGDNTKAALMTRGIKEIARLGIAMGADPNTFTGLSGIGDLIVTCTSMHSRNRRAGILIGKGKNLEETLAEIKMVVEGITATEVAYNVSKKLNIDMPITNAIYSVLYKGVSVDEVVTELMGRTKTHEVEENVIKIK